MPMVSAPPGRFSTTTGCPSGRDISGARIRATVSVALPAACGTTSRRGRSGYCAAAQTAAPASSSAAAARFTLSLQAGTHEGLALIAFLPLGLLVAVFHLVLLRLLLVGGARRLALQARAHELLPVVALLVARLGVAVLHPLLLRLLLFARFLLRLVLRQRGRRQHQRRTTEHYGHLIHDV